jgi:hypothetical protein
MTIALPQIAPTHAFLRIVTPTPPYYRRRLIEFDINRDQAGCVPLTGGFVPPAYKSMT